MARFGLVLAAFALALGGCGGSGSASGGGAAPALPAGTPVVTPGIESYRTDHDGFSRARVTPGDARGDAAVLAAFDRGATPAGYRSMVDGLERAFRDTTRIEVIAEVVPDGRGGDRATRLLRVTVDKAPFTNAGLNGRPVTEGQFFFRGVGQHQVWASVDGGPLREGRGDLENLMVDFGAERAAIDLRTGTGIGTAVRADNLTFDIRTGAFGGPVTMTHRIDADTTVSADGMLRGYITATPAGLSYRRKDMTAAGLYTVTGQRLSGDGVFRGTQPD